MVVVEHGTPVFVGQVAHIVAAVPSGPRGEVPVVDRDGFDNLLLLCGRHHKIIDDPATQRHYPAELLRGWKAARETDLSPDEKAELADLSNLPKLLPEILPQVFGEITAELTAAVDRLEAHSHVAHDMARLLHTALLIARPSGPAVGDGVPGVKHIFEDAYDVSGGVAVLGLPSTEVYEAGPGYAQHLRGGSCGHPAVICLLPEHPAVIVSSELWDAIAAVGGGGANGPQGAGLPVGSTTRGTAYIGRDVREIALSGGTWFNGRMIRESSTGSWRWVPDLAFDAEVAGHADIALGSRPTLDFRLRLLAHLPGQGSEPRISARGRRQLADALAAPQATDLVAVPAARRLQDLRPHRWQPTDDQFGRNDSWGATHECVAMSIDNQPAIRGRLQYLMPDVMRPVITAVSDLEFDFDRALLTQGPLLLSEIVDSFAEAWRLLFDVLPLADDNSSLRGALGRPRASLHLISEHPPNSRQGQTYRLSDLVDLSPFGSTHKSRLSRLDLGILGRASLPASEARDLVRSTLQRMAENAGFDRPDLVVW